MDPMSCLICGHVPAVALYLRRLPSGYWVTRCPSCWCRITVEVQLLEATPVEDGGRQA